jgi:hypothetical protein
MSTKTQICNLALSHLGQTKRIANVDTEQSQEASLFRVLYETARDVVLKEYEWPFATKLATLALIEEEPNSEWAFSYRYPSDCIKFMRILSGTRADTNSSRIPYKVSHDSIGKIIYCDYENAEGEYIEGITDTSLFSPDFVMALSFYLSSLAAPALTGGDPFKLGDRSISMYKAHLSKSISSSFNEEQPDIIQSELLTSRE